MLSYYSTPLQAITYLTYLNFSTGGDQATGFSVRKKKGLNSSETFPCSSFRLVWCYEFSICLQSWDLVIHLYIYNWLCCINQIPVLNGAFHGTLIRPDATRQQLYLLLSCYNKPRLKQTSLTFWIRCLRVRRQTTTARVRQFSTAISLPSQHRLPHLLVK